jgi:hypothetical protein
MNKQRLTGRRNERCKERKKQIKVMRKEAEKYFSTEKEFKQRM